MTENGSKKVQIKIGKRKLFNISAAVLTFFMLFTEWFKSEFAFYGMSLGTFKFNIFQKGVMDAGACFAIAKVLAIITLIVGVLFVIEVAINFQKFIPALKKFKFGFNRLFGLVYYGLFTLAILFNIIGCIAEKAAVPTVRIIFIFILMICLVLVYAIPAIAKFVSKKFDLVIE